MPGYLIPADLTRMIRDNEPFGWARQHLRASPGAKMMNLVTRQEFRIPTLVPAHRKDGSCHYLDAQNKCGVHKVAPFGCAFFGCGAIDDRAMANKGIHAVMDAMSDPTSLYCRVWMTLHDEGLVCVTPDEKRAAMAEAWRAQTHGQR